MGRCGRGRKGRREPERRAGNTKNIPDAITPCGRSFVVPTEDIKAGPRFPSEKFYLFSAQRPPQIGSSWNWGDPLKRGEALREALG